MTILLALSILSNVTLAVAFLQYLRSRDEREQTLLDRIQAPRDVVIQRVTQEAEPAPEPVSVFNDEDYWQHREEA